jgi:hypothetical protein
MGAAFVSSAAGVGCVLHRPELTGIACQLRTLEESLPDEDLTILTDSLWP